MVTENRGFLYVATADHIFYRSALYSIESLKEYWPEAKVCLFTHADWVDNRARKLCDIIITEDVPNHIRAKLWALDKTPFDTTVYMDCDTEVIHDDIQHIFDEIEPYNVDMAFTEIKPYAVKAAVFPAGTMTLHCGLFLYKNNERTRALMWDWWLSFIRFKDNGEWPFDEELYPREFQKWDTFGMWWLMNETCHKDQITYRMIDVRWNFIHTYKPEETNLEPVIWHSPVPNAR